MAIVGSIGSLSYSSYVLYISSRTIYIKNKARYISEFINVNIDKWNELYLLVSNNICSVTDGTTLSMCDENYSYVYICCKYKGD